MNTVEYFFARGVCVCVCLLSGWTYRSSIFLESRQANKIVDRRSANGYILFMYANRTNTPSDLCSLLLSPRNVMSTDTLTTATIIASHIRSDVFNLPNFRTEKI